VDYINKYVAPWVLPGQAIPIHCVWVPDKELKKISLSVPNNYVLNETLNFSSYDFDESKRELVIAIENLKSNNYFGIVISHPSIMEEIEKRDEIKVKFFDESNRIIDKFSFYTRIVRPKLELVDYPKQIVVTDSTNPKKLINLEILHSGFGTANLDINVKHSDIIISKSNSIYFDVIERVLEEINYSLDAKNFPEQEDFDVNDELLRKTVSVLLREADQSELLVDLDKEELAELKKHLKDEKKRELVYRILLSNLRSLYMAALLYYSERHPQEDIKLMYGKIAADLKDMVDELLVKIIYYDSLGNKYPVIETKIGVIDLRKHKKDSQKFDAPINIRWTKKVLDLGGD
jgi:hypothetical protein